MQTAIKWGEIQGTSEAVGKPLPAIDGLTAVSVHIPAHREHLFRRNVNAHSGFPDNLRSGVSKACRYDPDLNASYQQLAEHYQLTVVPARPYKPKDKSKAEVGVQIVERWILARLRHHSFFSLAEVNQCIRVLLDELNKKLFKQLPGNRLQAFEQLDKPALRPLPMHPYRYVEIKPVKPNIDYHVQHQKHHYLQDCQSRGT